MLSRAKSRDTVMPSFACNFEAEHIKINTAALQEILRRIKEALIFWHHPF